MVCNLCKILLEWGLRILVNEPTIGEKPLFIYFGPCLGSEDDGNRETGYKRVPTSQGPEALDPSLALRDAACLGCAHLLGPAGARQATRNHCSW